MDWILPLLIGVVVGVVFDETIIRLWRIGRAKIKKNIDHIE